MNKIGANYYQLISNFDQLKSYEKEFDRLSTLEIESLKF